MDSGLPSTVLFDISTHLNCDRLRSLQVEVGSQVEIELAFKLMLQARRTLKKICLDLDCSSEGQTSLRTPDSVGNKTWEALASLEDVSIRLYENNQHYDLLQTLNRYLSSAHDLKRLEAYGYDPRNLTEILNTVGQRLAEVDISDFDDIQPIYKSCPNIRKFATRKWANDIISLCPPSMETICIESIRHLDIADVEQLAKMLRSPLVCLNLKRLEMKDEIQAGMNEECRPYWRQVDLVCRTRGIGLCLPYYCGEMAIG